MTVRTQVMEQFLDADSVEMYSAEFPSLYTISTLPRAAEALDSARMDRCIARTISVTIELTERELALMRVVLGETGKNRRLATRSGLARETVRSYLHRIWWQIEKNLTDTEGKVSPSVD